MNTVLFDLDGTLLPMNQDAFMNTYFHALGSRLDSAGFNSKKVLNAIHAATEAMYQNDGQTTNEAVFMKKFRLLNPVKDENKFLNVMENFYKKDFEAAKSDTKPSPYVAKTVALLKKKGYRLAIATNPLFPEVAISKRIQWAGLNKRDFDWVTTYENSCFSKPNLHYYRQLIQSLGKRPKDCLMVGNDTLEDLCSVKIGVDVFLINEYLIDRNHVDLTDYNQGDWEAFYEFANSLPVICS